MYPRLKADSFFSIGLDFLTCQSRKLNMKVCEVSKWLLFFPWGKKPKKTKKNHSMYLHDFDENILFEILSFIDVDSMLALQICSYTFHKICHAFMSNKIHAFKFSTHMQCIQKIDAYLNDKFQQVIVIGPFVDLSSNTKISKWLIRVPDIDSFFVNIKDVLQKKITLKKKILQLRACKKIKKISTCLSRKFLH